MTKKQPQKVQRVLKLTTPGGLPMLWMMLRNAQTNLSLRLKAAIWLSKMHTTVSIILTVLP